MRLIFTFFILCVSSSMMIAQITLNQHFVGKGSYKDTKEGAPQGRSSAAVSSLDAKVPVWYKKDKYGKPEAWVALLSSSYTSLHNTNIPLDMSPKEIFDFNLGLAHVKNRSEKETMIYGMVLTAYSPYVDPFKLKLYNVFPNFFGIYIWQINQNLKLGAGSLVTMFFGYPLPVPFPYIEWKWGDRYKLDIEFVNSPTLNLSMMVSDRVKLSWVNSSKGSTAVQKVDGKKMMINHVYKVTALATTYRYKKTDLSFTAGIDYDRKMKYRERKFKSLFTSKGKNFSPTPYFAFEVRYNLW